MGRVAVGIARPRSDINAVRRSQRGRIQAAKRRQSRDDISAAHKVFVTKLQGLEACRAKRSGPSGLDLPDAGIADPRWHHRIRQHRYVVLMEGGDHGIGLHQPALVAEKVDMAQPHHRCHDGARVAHGIDDAHRRRQSRQTLRVKGQVGRLEHQNLDTGGKTILSKAFARYPVFPHGAVQQFRRQPALLATAQSMEPRIKPVPFVEQDRPGVGAGNLRRQGRSAALAADDGDHLTDAGQQVHAAVPALARRRAAKSSSARSRNAP